MSYLSITDKLCLFAQMSIVAMAAALASCGTEADNSELAGYLAAEKLANAQIAKFDTLNFEVFSNQKWDRLHESHASNVIVHWPDGHQTSGIEKHIADLKTIFVFAPDTRIQEHPVKVAQGEWTSVIGVMEGTFTEPMPTGDGKLIAPTGKSFRLIMCTVGHWKNGVMDEKYLFWDNLSYRRQIGWAP